MTKKIYRISGHHLWNLKGFIIFGKYMLSEDNADDFKRIYGEEFASFCMNYYEEISSDGKNKIKTVTGFDDYCDNCQFRKGEKCTHEKNLDLKEGERSQIDWEWLRRFKLDEGQICTFEELTMKLFDNGYIIEGI